MPSLQGPQHTLSTYFASTNSVSSCSGIRPSLVQANNNETSSEAECVSPGMPRPAFWTKWGLALCVGMTFSQSACFSRPGRAHNCRLFSSSGNRPSWDSTLTFISIQSSKSSPSWTWQPFKYLKTSIVVSWRLLFSSRSCSLGQHIWRELCVW